MNDKFSLAEKWLIFCEKHINPWMENVRKDDISYDEWRELLKEYKKTFFKEYER